jgi:hypothetical protein
MTASSCLQLITRGNPDFGNFQLVDAPNEKKFGFSLADSLAKAHKAKLLNGMQLPK